MNLRCAVTAYSAGQVAERARDMVKFLNGMMASRPGNPRLRDAVEFLRRECVSGPGDLPSGMLATPTLIGASNKALAVPGYLLNLQHLTPESDSR